MLGLSLTSMTMGLSPILLDVDAVEPVADEVGGLERGLHHGLGRLLDRDRVGPAIAGRPFLVWS